MYDNRKTNELVMKFICKNKVYLFKPSKKFFEEASHHRQLRNNDKAQGSMDDSEVAMVQTVKKNLEGYMQREVARAKVAMRMWRMMGAPSKCVFKAFLRMNQVKNCPVICEDVDIAEKIWGVPVALIKGKSTHVKREAIRDNLIDLPKELLDLGRSTVLCMDILKINTVYFLIMINKTIHY